MTDDGVVPRSHHMLLVNQLFFPLLECLYHGDLFIC